MIKNYKTNAYSSIRKGSFTAKRLQFKKPILFVAMVLVGFCTYAQTGVRNYANAYRGSASSASNATTSPYTDYATVSAGGFSSEDFYLIQPSNVDLNSTIFVKVDASDNVTLTAYKNTTTSNNGSAANGASSVITTAQDGSVYYAVSATEPFNAVKITVNGGIIGNSTKVYFAFNDVGNTVCSPISTSPVDANPNIFNLLIPTVINSLDAIDNNMSTYSKLSPAIVSSGNLSQTVYMSGLSKLGDAATVTYSVPASLISVGLNYSVTLSAYNGTTLVGSKNLGSLITLNILGIFNNSQPVTLSFVPSQVFDRLVVTLSFAVQVGSDGVNVYDVSRTTAPPSVGTTDTVRVNKGTKAVLKASSTYGTDVISWYSSPNILTGTLLGTGNTYTTPAIIDTTRYYVSASNAGCNKQSQRTLIVVIPSSTVLPATNLTLSGSLSTGKPILTWSTLQETNTSYYSIEASTDGVGFTRIGKVSAAGNSSVPSYYTFTDVTNTSDVVYYRIKLVDIDGGVTYSNVFSLRLSGSALAKVYPNPITNFVNIETGAPGSYVTELFTVDGRKITSTTLNTASGLVTFTINRSNVTSGIYLLKVTNKATATSTYNTIMVK